MNVQAETNPDVSAVAAVTDQNNHSHGCTSLFDLIQSTSEESKNDQMDQLTIRISPPVLAILKETARQTHQPIAQIVRACLLHALKGELRGNTECRGESMNGAPNE